MKHQIKSITIKPVKNGYIVSFKEEVDTLLYGKSLVTSDFVCLDFSSLVERLVREGFFENNQDEIACSLKQLNLEKSK